MQNELDFQLPVSIDLVCGCEASRSHSVSHLSIMIFLFRIDIINKKMKQNNSKCPPPLVASASLDRRITHKKRGHQPFFPTRTAQDPGKADASAPPLRVKLFDQRIAPHTSPPPARKSFHQHGLYNIGGGCVQTERGLASPPSSERTQCRV